MLQEAWFSGGPGAKHLGRPDRPKKSKEKKGPKGLPGTNRRLAPKRTLENALARMVMSSSDCVYEATIISSLDRRSVQGRGTCGVEFVGDRPTLYYDPDFIAEISDHELKVTLKHEVMHLTLHHQVRGAMIRRRFNFEGSDLREKLLQQQAHWLASDWAVNELLLREEPAMGYQNRIIGYWALPAEHDMPVLRSYEEYFPMALKLLRDARAKREKEQAEARKNAACNGSDGTVVVLLGPVQQPEEKSEEKPEEKPSTRTRPANLQELLDAAEAIAAHAAEDEAKAAEVHDLLGEDNSEASEQTLHAVLALIPAREERLPSQGELVNVVHAILEAAERTLRGHGKSTPNVYGRAKVTPPREPLRGIRGLIAALETIEPTNPTAGYSASMRHVSRPAAARSLYYRKLGGQFVQLSRRMPLFPGVESTAPSLTLGIVLDTSCSMSQRMLSGGIAIVRDVMEELGIEEGVLLECDDRAVRALRLERGVDLPTELVGRGGTNFDPGLEGAMKWARDNGVTLDGIVYITDGDAPCPRVRVDVPVVWAIVGADGQEVLPDVPGNINVMLKEVV